MNRFLLAHRFVKKLIPLVLTTLAFGLTSCSSWERQNLRNIVPSQIGIEKEHVSEWSGSFDESQGFALYELSAETSARIQSTGISFFDEIIQGQDSKWPLKDWQVTKSPIDYAWIESSRAHRLIDQQKWADDEIHTIYHAKTRFGGGIVIIPKAHLVNVYFTQ